MSHKVCCFVIFSMAFLLPCGAAVQATDITQKNELELKPLSVDMKVEARCGDFFGYDMIPGTSLKRVSFNYESEDRIFFRSVAYSTIRTEIDDTKDKPTVVFTPTGTVIVKISEKEYQKAKDCIPAATPPTSPR